MQNIEFAEHKSDVLKRLGLEPNGYLMLTFHRSENVDAPERLERALEAFAAVIKETGLPMVFPVHPRTARRIQEFGLEKLAASIASLRRIEPASYFDTLVLEKNAAGVLTDSGGLQEESCFFRVPCVTLRESTERPETLDIGANVLTGLDRTRILAAVHKQLESPRAWANPYGDGTTSARIADIIDAGLR
jgi:UDP-N-acetylglucosamine 2-epimerase (non-hydrolysing)